LREAVGFGRQGIAATQGNMSGGAFYPACASPPDANFPVSIGPYRLPPVRLANRALKSLENITTFKQ
jgi:hypothetical protein